MVAMHEHISFTMLACLGMVQTVADLNVAFSIVRFHLTSYSTHGYVLGMDVVFDPKRSICRAGTRI